jgi:hypothetical protein
LGSFAFAERRRETLPKFFDLEVHHELRHFLQRRSYGKALALLEA